MAAKIGKFGANHRWVFIKPEGVLDGSWKRTIDASLLSRPWDWTTTLRNASLPSFDMHDITFSVLNGKEWRNPRKLDGLCCAVMKLPQAWIRLIVSSPKLAGQASLIPHLEPQCLVLPKLALMLTQKSSVVSITPRYSRNVCAQTVLSMGQ